MSTTETDTLSEQEIDQLYCQEPLPPNQIRFLPAEETKPIESDIHDHAEY